MRLRYVHLGTSTLSEMLSQPLWPEHADVACTEGSTNQRPIGFDEAQRADNR